MSETGGNANGPRANQIRNLVASLDEEAKNTLAAELARDRDVHDAARKTAVAEAVRTAVDEDKEELAAEAVRVAPPEAKKTAASEAVRTAPEAAKDDITAEAVRAAPPEAKKLAAAEAVRTAPAVNKQDVAAEAMRSLPSDEAREELARQFLPPPTQPVVDEIG
jgi:hypothetical protein